MAFTLIGGSTWTGGLQYLQNLLEALASHVPDRIAPVLFVGDDVSDDSIRALTSIAGLTLVRSPAFNARRRQRALLQSIIVGRDGAAAREFSRHQVDVVFEAAQFFGARLAQPALAWIPDFQHRYLPHLFSRSARMKREFGFRAQVRGDRTIVLSSEDARRDCEKFYPRTVGRTRVLPFAVPAPRAISPDVADAVVREYQLPGSYFFMPNQFWQHKNHALVVEALELLKARGRTDIVIAASGRQLDPRNAEHFPSLERRINATGITGQFRLLGLIPREHLAALMQNCVALLNPSLFEGWSTTVEEAKSIGVPLLLSDLAVHQEQAGDQAIYFRRDSAAALADALSGFRPPGAGDRARLDERARSASEARVAAFAENFAAIAESITLRPSRARTTLPN